ncbi:ribokinase [Celerinatantimonas sp. MCCC 1A17872]|uniref:ribokinase n=1 Tax=Celerinatantimonas sp. MCCC 1A17872 TaxID=3177514 RepID=UPI0038C094A9
MFTEERRRLILEFLNQHDRATVNELAEMFHVSTKTIRNDFNFFSKNNVVSRCYGGAILIRRKMQDQVIKRYGSEINSIFKTNIEPKPNQSRGAVMTGNVCVMGSFNVDIVAKVQRFPQKGETLKALDSILGPGGKGANQALAASKAGAKVHFVAKVGKDHFSNVAFEHLENSGIHSFTLYQSDSDPTGNALIYVSQNDGENMIAICPGANQTITDEEVQAIKPQLAEADVLVVQLENNISATLTILKLAKQLGVFTILNPAPYSREVELCLPYVDLITPNETEASEISGITITDKTSAIAASEQILAKGVSQAVITLGANGVVSNDNGKTQYWPAFKAVSVDTTGAGDSFNGALAAALSAGQRLSQAVKFAAAFASLAVEQEGASAMPDKEQALSRMNSQNPTISAAFA